LLLARAPVPDPEQRHPPPLLLPSPRPRVGPRQSAGASGGRGDETRIDMYSIKSNEREMSACELGTWGGHSVEPEYKARLMACSRRCL
jgi:hypothetical protein